MVDLYIRGRTQERRRGSSPRRQQEEHGRDGEGYSGRVSQAPLAESVSGEEEKWRSNSPKEQKREGEGSPKQIENISETYV